MVEYSQATNIRRPLSSLDLKGQLRGYQKPERSVTSWLAERAIEEKLWPTHKPQNSPSNPNPTGENWLFQASYWYTTSQSQTETIKRSVDRAHIICLLPRAQSKVENKAGGAKGEYEGQKGILNDYHTAKHKHIKSFCQLHLLDTIDWSTKKS